VLCGNGKYSEGVNKETGRGDKGTCRRFSQIPDWAVFIQKLLWATAGIHTCLVCSMH